MFNKINVLKLVLFFLYISMIYYNSCSDNPTTTKEENSPPIASFIVSPDSGDTSTIYKFDASECIDNEDNVSTLKIRWDWDTDGSWDTEFTTTKIDSHKYSTPGIKLISLEVKDTGGQTDSASKQITVSITNTAPKAHFIVTPDTGDVSTIFQFDATHCSDNEDSISQLNIRWDWENDGTWDTDYSTTKSTNHQYLSEGIKYIALEVKDTGGLLDTVVNQLTVLSLNNPPVASFTTSLTSGNTSTVFEFDASDSWDNEDSTLLDIRWDWENDGTWDTDYTSIKTVTHHYSEEGTKTIKLEVLDSGGLTNTTTRQVVVSDTPFTDTTVTDIDGNIYKIVNIGDQYWMAENLKVTRYRNGDVIPNVTNNNDWRIQNTGAYCSYGNNASYIETYGLLYNWYVVNDSRNIAPEGWHIPTQSEWQTLINYLGGQQIASGKMKEIGTVHWHSPNIGATNESGFTALPGGYRDRNGSFRELTFLAEFWEKGFEFSWGLYSGGTSVSGTVRFNRDGISIRCVKD
jgi:uncharacterized protein (TIGR02145 family)